MLVVHVDESAVCTPPEEPSDQQEQQIWASIADCFERDQFVCLPLEDVYSIQQRGSANPKSRLDRRKKLHALIQVKHIVSNSSGSGDLVMVQGSGMLIGPAMT